MDAIHSVNQFKLYFDNLLKKYFYMYVFKKSNLKW